mmetsp:Transcript_15002/g.50331  ORF Transcript_15002/g.50331 Transcript_15002/m.50331 type:complete len:243 (-) Transcript_15002:2951-3679(-)
MSGNLHALRAVATTSSAVARASFSAAESMSVATAWYAISVHVFSLSSNVTKAATRAASCCATPSASSTARVATATAALHGSASTACSAFCAAKMASRAAATALDTVVMPEMMKTSTWMAPRRSEAKSREPWNSRRASSIACFFSIISKLIFSAARTRWRAASILARRAAARCSGERPSSTAVAGAAARVRSTASLPVEFLRSRFCVARSQRLAMAASSTRQVDSAASAAKAWASKAVESLGS